MELSMNISRDSGRGGQEIGNLPKKSRREGIRHMYRSWEKMHKFPLSRVEVEEGGKEWTIDRTGKKLTEQSRFQTNIVILYMIWTTVVEILLARMENIGKNRINMHSFDKKIKIPRLRRSISTRISQTRTEPTMNIILSNKNYNIKFLRNNFLQQN